MTTTPPPTDAQYQQQVQRVEKIRDSLSASHQWALFAAGVLSSVIALARAIPASDVAGRTRMYEQLQAVQMPPGLNDLGP
jgi:hypothetical protein